MDKTLNYLGLARKAGKLIFGEEILDGFARGEVMVLFIASDISPKSRERFLKKCFFYKTEYIDTYSSTDLCRALGKSGIKTTAITDKGFADAILKERRCVNAENSEEKQSCQKEQDKNGVYTR